MVALLSCGEGDMRVGFSAGVGGWAATQEPNPLYLPSESLAGTIYSWWEVGRSETIVTTGGHSEYWATALADLGPRGRHWASNNAASQSAKYEPGSFNGLPSVAFDGGNDFFDDAGAGLLPTEMLGGSNKTFTFWWVGQWFVQGVDNVAFSFGANASTPILDFFTGANGKFRVGKNNGTAKFVDSATASDKLRHWFKFKTDVTGTMGQLSVDGVVVQDFSLNNFATTATTFTRAALGALWRTSLSLFFNGRFKMMTMLAAVPTAVQEAQMDAYCASMTAPQTAPMLLINGDSLSTPDRWQVNAMIDYPNATFVNTSVPGFTGYGFGFILPYKNRDTLSIYDSNRSGNVNYFGFGSNDIVNAQTGASIYANYQSMVTQIRASKPNCKIIVPTIGWRTGLSASEETQRQAFNAAMRGDMAGADYLDDRDNKITSSPADQALLLDGTHPGPVGMGYYWNGRNGYPGIRDFVASAGGF